MMQPAVESSTKKFHFEPGAKSHRVKYLFVDRPEGGDFFRFQPCPRPSGPSLNGDFRSPAFFPKRLAAILMLLIAGCGTALDTGHNTALDGADLVGMTDQMSAAILANPLVQRAIAQQGPLKVVVEPVTNEMQGEVLPRGAADAFTARLRFLLSRHAPDQFTWIMNLGTFKMLRAQELQTVDLGPPPGEISPDYELTATFTSMASENDRARSDYYVCTFYLNNLKDRKTLWTKAYEVKKRAVKGFLD
jgi:hypothetical protein